MSTTQLTYHIILGTYRRIKTISIDNERLLYTFIYNFSTKRGIKIRRLGGMPDHIHLLCDIPPTMAVCQYIKILKSESSKFMRFVGKFPLWEGWAEGYGCFTVDASSIEIKRQYIQNQKEHHKIVPFMIEYRQILNEEGCSDAEPLLG